MAFGFLSGLAASAGLRTRTAAPADEHAARELYLFAINDGQLYENIAAGTIRNLAHKVRTGTYNDAKAVVAWRRLADAAATKYRRELGGDQFTFGPATRQRAAEQLRDAYRAQLGGNGFAASIDLPARAPSGRGVTNRWGEVFKPGVAVEARAGSGWYLAGRYVKLAPASGFSRAYGRQAIIRDETGHETEHGLDDLRVAR